VGGKKMGSTFGGIEIGKRALQTQKKSMDVTGHNISNASNEEYSRQRARQTATDPHPYPALHNNTGAGQIGTGVEVSKIERVRDQFVDQRLRGENRSLGKWSVKKENLQEVEKIFNELEQGGLVNTMDEFWSSVHEVANNPESMSVREAAIQKGVTLTTQFNHTAKNLKEYRKQLGSEIEGRVDKFNDHTKRIARLNQQIKAIETDTSKKANDLMDKRDDLLDKLSKIADASYKIDKDNQVNVSLNGINIVYGKYQNQLNHSTKTVDKTVDGVNYQYEKYEFSVGNNQAKIKDGEIKGFMESRKKIQDYKMNKLDKLARELASEINTEHSAGFGLNGTTGENFFEFAAGEEKAEKFQIRDAIKNDPAIIAAAENDPTTPSGGQGDGENALDIAQLRNKDGVIGGTNFNDFWERETSKIGISIERANRMENNQQVLTDNLKQKREEVSGVSLDEEMAEMIKYQQGYNAAAKIVTKMDELFTTLNSIVR